MDMTTVWSGLPSISTRILKPGLNGDFQMHNLAVAVTALEVSGAIQGCAGCRFCRGSQDELPGRYEIRSFQGRRFILDGAHNAEAASSVVDTLKESKVKLPVVLVTSRLTGHDARQFYEALKPVVGQAIVLSGGLFQVNGSL